MSVGFSVRSVQCQSIASAQFVCLLLFSVGSVQLSVAFSVSTVSVAFRVCTDQWVMLRLYSLVSAVFKSSLSCPHFDCPLPLRSS